jgi:prepilin-type N-terminal cleavage/methylation domain-containing protein
MKSQRAFSLTEILIAMILMGLVILAATSVDITSRRFFGTSSSEQRLQDEAKIGLEHMVKYVQQGIGDMTNPGTSWSEPEDDNSRGVYSLSISGTLVAPGQPSKRLQVKIDGLNGPCDGKFDPDDSNDGIVEYEFYREAYNQPAVLRFYPDATVADRDDENNYEIIARNIVYNGSSFRIYQSAEQIANLVIVGLDLRPDPVQPVSPENPEISLSSRVILRAMSIK